MKLENYLTAESGNTREIFKNKLGKLFLIFWVWIIFFCS